MSRSCLGLALLLGTLAVHPSGAGQDSPGLMPVSEIHAGMTGVGRTVFRGDAVEDFGVEILGVLHNVIGPKRDLILAKLSGGPLAETGVIAGMSGSPVYVDGRLIGAVSYSLGSFPREPIAGITPIGEMTSDTTATAPRARTTDLGLPASPTSADVFTALRRIVERATTPASPAFLPATTPASLVALAPALRPIGAAFVMSGFDPSVSASLRAALGDEPASEGGIRQTLAPASLTTLHPGDPVGVSLVSGDFEMGATGTVTYVDGPHVYAFGHPFLNLGSTTMTLRQAHIYSILPSLDSSMKIAGMGQAVGTLTQDRSSAIGGLLGAPPRELRVTVSLTSGRAAEQRFAFSVVHDQTLTPLFAYVAVLNALASYERQNGVLTAAASGTIDFGPDGTVTIDDMFSGENVSAGAAATVLGPITAMATNEWHAALPDAVNLRITTSEQQTGATIERAWLDTTRPVFGATHTLHIMLRNFRGTSETVSLPVTMPAQASGPLTLMVSDAPTLTTLEQREIQPGKPTSVAGLVQTLNLARRNQTIYVRLLASSSGAVVAGDTLPTLPVSARDVFNADRSQATAALSRSVVGAWELRLDRVVRGSREWPITLTAKHH